ncbi:MULTISPECIES: hypothetical protein [Methanobacterium]|jgi:hypothetical protein|uniref:Uncharacterized protein n=1 Tax=Methanobacterium subterraneum TaxID=59277 RepID=A0A2H4VME5_9EURY|nr:MULTISPECIES: hypothetical protein [Methanobacterium]MBW4256896.1 hypothetical protein [Methanobacterium sp. YSL]AUB58245.1 hypothetical protein BK008_07905 [Methanobacterium sp. MZ-A1]AUB59226.1 hypothetical protein BK009_00110 [Methanobacterium subterraneum]MCC7559045.1 hypothetical protein [Methanobacterium sp.]NMO08804.1 hypothetical protein [Methanobacterium subterraneum]
MNKVLKMNKKKIFIIYIVLDMFYVGIGMGVPVFCILFGFPVGWYLSERLTLPEKNLNNIFNQILKCAFYTSLFTFILMLVIWVPVSATLFDPAADFANFGIPMILYDPKISFIGWIILMIFISPFLQLLTTVFASNMVLWRLSKKIEEGGKL